MSNLINNVSTNVSNHNPRRIRMKNVNSVTAQSKRLIAKEAKLKARIKAAMENPAMDFPIPKFNPAPAILFGLGVNRQEVNMEQRPVVNLKNYDQFKFISSPSAFERHAKRKAAKEQEAYKWLLDQKLDDKLFNEYLDNFPAYAKDELEDIEYKTSAKDCADRPVLTTKDGKPLIKLNDKVDSYTVREDLLHEIRKFMGISSETIHMNYFETTKNEWGKDEAFIIKPYTGYRWKQVYSEEGQERALEEEQLKSLCMNEGDFMDDELESEKASILDDNRIGIAADPLDLINGIRNAPFRFKKKDMFREEHKAKCISIFKDLVAKRVATMHKKKLSIVKAQALITELLDISPDNKRSFWNIAKKKTGRNAIGKYFKQEVVNLETGEKTTTSSIYPELLEPAKFYIGTVALDDMRKIKEKLDAKVGGLKSHLYKWDNGKDIFQLAGMRLKALMTLEEMVHYNKLAGIVKQSGMEVPPEMKFLGGSIWGIIKSETASI